MKRRKEDKKFWIQFDQINRDSLMNVSMFLLSFSISMIALLISVIAIIIAIDGITSYSITVTIIFGIILIAMAFKISFNVKKILKNSKNVNEQLQKELFESYPEYKNKFH